MRVPACRPKQFHSPKGSKLMARIYRRMAVKIASCHGVAATFLVCSAKELRKPSKLSEASRSMCWPTLLYVNVSGRMMMLVLLMGRDSQVRPNTLRFEVPLRLTGLNVPCKPANSNTFPLASFSMSSLRQSEAKAAAVPKAFTFKVDCRQWSASEGEKTRVWNFISKKSMLPWHGKICESKDIQNHVQKPF